MQERNQMLKVLVFVGTIAYSCIASATIGDNQYIPLLPLSRIAFGNEPSLLQIDYMMTTASSALSNQDAVIGIPELYGTFDLGQLADSFETTGMGNPLPSELQGSKIPFRVEGKIQSQGVALSYYQQLNSCFSCGASLLFMRVNSRQAFFLKQDESTINFNELVIDSLRRQMFDDLGLENRSSQLGFGDVDLFIRGGIIEDYACKFRHIDAGLRVGLLIPSGEKRELDKPTSIPFGGNGHWGMYVQAEGLFELKEDWKFGLLLRASKRFKKTMDHRMPAEREPFIYGTIVGPARINPGATYIFSPYIAFEGLRSGFGFSLTYTLTKHQEDGWRDKRNNEMVPATLKEVIELSEWGTDYFTVQLFYDFDKVKARRSLNPILSFRWDIPSMLYLARNTPKTHRASLGIGFAF